MQNLNSVVGIDAILEHYQKAYPISKLGNDGPVNFVEGKNIDSEFAEYTIGLK